MKTCTECGHDFKPKGRQKVCGECKHAMQERVQEADAETRPQRPLERFGSGRFVFGNGAGVMLRR